MTSKNNWTVLDAHRQTMRCCRCGIEKPMSDINGKEVTAAVKIIREFTAQHDDCKTGDEGRLACYYRATERVKQIETTLNAHGLDASAAIHEIRVALCFVGPKK